MRFIIKLKRAYWSSLRWLLLWRIRRLIAQHNLHVALGARALHSLISEGEGPDVVPAAPKAHLDLDQVVAKLYGSGRTLNQVRMRDLQVLRIYLVNTQRGVRPLVEKAEPPPT